MNKFVEDQITAVIKREGGYSNHPKDRGGPTKYGITKGTLEAYLKRPVTIEEVRNLDIEQAREIYRTNYYYAPRIHTLPDIIEPICFDAAVHHGQARPILFVQQVVNDAGFGPVDVDGVLGPETRKAAEACAESAGDWMNDFLVEERDKFLKWIVDNDPTQRDFIEGWRNRIDKFRVHTKRVPDEYSGTKT